MKRLLAPIVVLASLALASPSAAATSVSFALNPTAAFPQRAFTVTLPTGASPYDVQVTENGVPVIPHFTSASSARNPLSLAVILDTSDSMRGQPLHAAVEATRTLIMHKPDRSEVALYGFNKDSYEVHGWSRDAAVLDSALQNLQTARGTALWDAVTMGSQQVAVRHSASRAVLLLTDGADTDSIATAATAAKAARAEHVRVFAVGLPGVRASSAEIESLVNATGGEFVQVDSLDRLSAVYADLAARLGRQYTMTYTSQLRGTGKDVTVALHVGSATAEQRYTIPAMRVGVPTREETWWTKDSTFIIVLLAVALIVLVAVYFAVRPMPERPHRRLAAYARQASPTEDVEAALTEEIRARRRRLAGRPAANRFWARFVADVDRGELGRTPKQVVAVGAILGTVAFLILAAVTSVWQVMLLGPFVGLAAAWWYVGRRASAWYRHFDDTLADSLTVLASSLRAGHSLLQAIDHVAEEADERTAREWAEVVRETRLGVSVEDAMDHMCDRVGSKDLRWIALVARIQHQVGGNMAEMFDIVADTVRQRHRLRAVIHTLTAQGRMSRWVLTLAPVVIGFMMFLLSPEYITSFLSQPVGKVLIAGALVAMTVGSLWLKQIVEIEV